MTDRETLLKQLLHYDPDTGVFTWRVRRQRIAAGTVAGSINHGYRRIPFAGKNRGAHQLAWLYMTETWPQEIDHINRDPGDNRWSNLRLATRSDNARNRKTRVDNGSGAKGICWDTRSGRWRSYIWSGNRQIHLGYYDSLDAARHARQTQASQLFGEFA